MTTYKKMTQKELKEKILDIITYHSDGGTSGYALSNEQVDKIMELFSEREEEIKEKIEKLEKEMVEGAGWERMHELVLDILKSI